MAEGPLVVILKEKAGAEPRDVVYDWRIDVMAEQGMLRWPAST